MATCHDVFLVRLHPGLLVKYGIFYNIKNVLNIIVKIDPDIDPIFTQNKGFPKPFRDTTLLEKGKYPQYRRRDNGRSITRTYKGVTYVLTNQHVVPHNPYLLKYFKSHICIEICAFETVTNIILWSSGKDS